MSSYSKYRGYDSNRSSFTPRPRAKARRKIMGVCAGLANQFGWDIYTLRMIALLGLFFATLPTLAIYLFVGAVFY